MVILTRLSKTQDNNNQQSVSPTCATKSSSTATSQTPEKISSIWSPPSPATERVKRWWRYSNSCGQQTSDRQKPQPNPIIVGPIILYGAIGFLIAHGCLTSLSQSLYSSSCLARWPLEMYHTLDQQTASLDMPEIGQVGRN